MKDLINFPAFKTQPGLIAGADFSVDLSRALAVQATPLQYAGVRPQPRRRTLGAYSPMVESAASRRYRQTQSLASQNGPQALDIYL